ncbi:hypothetical protein LUZ61_005004 [Rhynchospora tenuis]|uniref:SKP1-like protein n=1 Tax=Rhynchospora tenuis TaxID=198213 RepID=A0AAD5ZNS7_9POAL|nr:hypothetical protein LUZ61_005004 [Rhynchospora tenuis]
MASSSTVNMITLTSSDGEEFVVNEKVARECLTIRNMMEDDCVITNIPLPNVTSRILSIVIEYCQKHVAEAEKEAAAPIPETAEEESSTARAAPKASNKDFGEGSSSAPDKVKTKTAEEGSSSATAAAKAKKQLEDWDKAFMDVDNNTLYDLILAANYLNVGGLLHLACQTVADKLKGKQPEEIREIFQIKNDFSPEEEDAIHKEHPWAFE